MQDRTRLSANIFRPKADGAYPTILMCTPYGKGDSKNGQARAFVAAGYAMVIQDCRGRGDSEGQWDPFRYDVEDGFDTQQWVGKQSWCNGKIGTAGGSYVGWTQWASAPKQVLFSRPWSRSFLFATHMISLTTAERFNLRCSCTGALRSAAPRFPADRTDEAFRFLPLNRLRRPAPERSVLSGRLGRTPCLR